jgi:hypothetical protein
MRPPVKSETDAFRQTIGAAVAIIIAVLVGVLASPVAGVVVAVVALAAAVLAYVLVGRRDRRLTLREAASASHPHGPPPGVRHVLVVANEPLSGAALREHIGGDGDRRVEVDVLAPVLTSRLHLGVTDIDRELAQARARLETSLAWAHGHGLDARGRVGDPSTTTAIEDELRDFGADEVIVVTRGAGYTTRQEREELERLRRELDVPVTDIAAG